MFRPVFHTLLNSTSRRAFSSASSAQDVARLIVCGRVVKDPETIEPPSGVPFLKYTVATGFGRGEARRSTFWNVAVFDDRQKEIVSMLSKGSLVYVDADIECKSVPDESGRNQTYINLYQRHINVLIRPREAAPVAEAEADAEGREETPAHQA